MPERLSVCPSVCLSHAAAVLRKTALHRMGVLHTDPQRDHSLFLHPFNTATV